MQHVVRTSSRYLPYLAFFGFFLPLQLIPCISSLALPLLALPCHCCPCLASPSLPCL